MNFLKWCTKYNRQDLMDAWDYEENAKRGITPENINSGLRDTSMKIRFNLLLKSPVTGEMCVVPYDLTANEAKRFNGNVQLGFVVKGFNDLETWCRYNNRQDILDAWDYERNGCRPDEIRPAGDKGKKYSFIRNDGSRYESLLGNVIRTRKTIDQDRTMFSFQESALYFYVKQICPDAVLRDRSNGVEFDVFVPSLNTAFEYDGGAWHKEERLTADRNKNKFCREHGIRLFRIRDKECAEMDAREVDGLIINEGQGDVNLSQAIGKCLEKAFCVEINPNTRKDNREIQTLRNHVEVENSIAITNPELLNDWDYEENGRMGITPESVTAGSGIEVFWKREGEISPITGKPVVLKWKDSVKRRTGGKGCPYLGNAAHAYPGYNDFLTYCEKLKEKTGRDVLASIDYEELGNFDLSSISMNSRTEIPFRVPVLHDKRVIGYAHYTMKPALIRKHERFDPFLGREESIMEVEDPKQKISHGMELSLIGKNMAREPFPDAVTNPWQPSDKPSFGEWHPDNRWSSSKEFSR